MLLQGLTQGIKGTMPLLARLARVHAERLLDRQIMVIAPPCEGRDVMRSERHQRVLAIALRWEEHAGARALEQHDLVGPDAPVSQRLAEIFGNGAEIFADYDASILLAGGRSGGQHRLDGETAISDRTRPDPDQQ